MNLLDKEQYVEYLKKLKFKYREKLNFKDDLTFGVEMVKQTCYDRGNDY